MQTSSRTKWFGSLVHRPASVRVWPSRPRKWARNWWYQRVPSRSWRRSRRNVFVSPFELVKYILGPCQCFLLHTLSFSELCGYAVWACKPTVMVCVARWRDSNGKSHWKCSFRGWKGPQAGKWWCPRPWDGHGQAGNPQAMRRGSHEKVRKGTALFFSRLMPVYVWNTFECSFRIHLILAFKISKSRLFENSPFSIASSFCKNNSDASFT